MSEPWEDFKDTATEPGPWEDFPASGPWEDFTPNPQDIAAGINAALDVMGKARGALDIGLKSQQLGAKESQAAYMADVNKRSAWSPVLAEKALRWLGAQGEPGALIGDTARSLEDPLNIPAKTINAVAGRPVVAELKAPNLEGLVQQPAEMVLELSGLSKYFPKGPGNIVTGAAQGIEEVASGFLEPKTAITLPVFGAGAELAAFKTAAKAYMAGQAIKGVPESIQRLKEVIDDPNSNGQDIAREAAKVAAGGYIAGAMTKAVPTSLPGIRAGARGIAPELRPIRAGEPVPGKPEVPVKPAETTIETSRQLKERFIKERIASGIKDENIRFSITPEETHPETGGKIPGYIQVDEIHPKLGNTFSSNPEQLKQLGLDVPSSEELLKLPMGRYTLPQIREMLKSKPPTPTVQPPSVPSATPSETTAAAANVPITGGTPKAATPSVKPTPAATGAAQKMPWEMTAEERAEHTNLKAKDLTEDGLSKSEEQRLFELNRKETRAKRNTKTQKESASLREAGVEIQNEFYNPSEGVENHITGWTRDKNGFIQIRVESHTDGSVSTKLVTVKPGDALHHGMNDTVAGSTRYAESNPDLKPAPPAAPAKGEKGNEITAETLRVNVFGQQANRLALDRFVTDPALKTRDWNLSDFDAAKDQILKSRPSKARQSALDLVDDLKQRGQRFIEMNRPQPIPPTEGGAEKSIPMGGATPEEFQQGQQTPTGIKNATVDAERAKRGLPPAIQPARRSFGKVWDEAMAKIDHDPGYPDRLIGELQQKPRALTDLEDATLLHRQIDLQNEYGKATRDLAQAFDDGRMEAVGNEQARVAGLSNQLLDLYNVGKRVGTETGRGLAARKMMAYEDFTLAKMEMEKRVANEGRPLTDAERLEVVRLNQKIEQTQKAYDDFVAKTQEREAARAVKDALDEIERKARQQPVVEPHIRIIADKIKVYFDNRADAALKRLSRKMFTISPQLLADLTDLGVSRILGGAARFAEWSIKMTEVVGDRIGPHLQTVWESSQRALDAHVERVTGGKSEKVKRAVKGIDVETQKVSTTEKIKESVDGGKRNEIAPMVQKLARLFVEQGVREREALIDAVHGVLKEIDPEFTRRDTMDAISGYGDFKQLNKDEISVQLRDLKGQMQQVAKIEDMQAKLAPKKTGIERRSPSDEERRLIKLVNEQKRKGGFVVTDPATQLASALSARKTYYQNRISDLKTEIASRERLVKTKTPSPTDTRLEALKSEYETLRKEHAEIFEKPGLTDAQRLELSEKSATRQIAELERQIKTGEIFPASKKPFSGTSPALEAAKARIEALKAERQWAREAAGPNPQPLDVEAQRRAASLDKQIETIESQIKNETVFPKGKTGRVETPENAAKLKEIEDLKQQRQFIRERLQPKPERDLEALALTAKKARLARQIADLRDRLARGDFTKKPKRVIAMDAEADKLSFEANQAKSDWHKALMLDKLAKRSIPAKIFGGIGEALNTSRAILTSLDLSAVLRQGGFIAFAHPIRAAKSFPAMFKAFRSEAGQHAVDREIVSRKNYQLYNQGKLYLSEHGQKLSKMEEAYMSRWADKIPLVAGSQRAYVTFLNKLRADSFDAMADSLARSGELTPVEVNAISNFINVATGRGNLGMKENALVGLNTIFFAPRYVASRFQLLAGQPLYRGSARTRALIAKEYGRFLIGAAVVYGLAQLDGAEIETDVRSSDFGKLRYGNTRVDPMAGLLQSTVLLGRLGLGETKTANGKVVPIRGEKVPFGSSTSSDVIGRFLRSKLSPALGTGLNILTGKDVVGQPVTPSSVTQNLLVPLAWQDIYATMKEQGVPHGTIMAILSAFGMGLQNYEQKPKPEPASSFKKYY